MNESETIKNELRFFSDFLRVFTLEDVVERIDTPVNPQVIYNHLLVDDRFLCVKGSAGRLDLFISKRAVRNWYIYLTVHLGKARHARISEREFLFLTRALTISKSWDRPPKEILDFGEMLGIVECIERVREYVFPLAHLLSFVPAYSCRTIVKIMKDGLAKESVEEIVRQTVDHAICHLKPLEAYILLCRIGGLTNLTLTVGLLQTNIYRKLLAHLFSAGSRLTLDQIANKIGYTRERIRQIEKKACSRQWLVGPLLKALIYDVLSRRSRLICEIDSQYPVRALIAKCLGIPCVKIIDSRSFIMGLSSEDLKVVINPKQTGDTRSTVEWIESTIRPVFFRDDIEKLSTLINRRRPKHSSAAEKALSILESINRPAHYSEIAEVYNELFPDAQVSEAYMKSVLHTRQCKNQGIVWIGARGMFALKKWGYEQPRQSLQQTAIEVVQRIYKVIQKPVPFEVIIAELGKHRKFVRQSSLNASIKANPGLERISNRLFIPKELGDHERSVSADSLDKILQRFEHSHGLPLAARIHRKADMEKGQVIRKSRQTGRDNEAETKTTNKWLRLTDRPLTKKR